ILLVIIPHTYMLIENQKLDFSVRMMIRLMIRNKILVFIHGILKYDLYLFRKKSNLFNLFNINDDMYYL
ncbi:hypothetical protein DID74_02645, partial [Candidatus Marinamargulisbacteria bacterium SCGC AG-333-B06]